MRFRRMQAMRSALLEKNAVGAFLFNEMPRVLQEKTIFKCQSCKLAAVLTFPSNQEPCSN